ESVSYQTMLEQVEGIVRSVSSGPMDLDEVVGKVEQGYNLIKVMRERLDATKAKVERLRTDFEKESAGASASVQSTAKNAHNQISNDANDSSHTDNDAPGGGQNEIDSDDDSPF
ncbi:MAG: exodeoxyribonuclease VII small subunit, partial [Proteobacteria bacterium]|nr:exodeoxyribonuclease VII small subunit [Pseudomonadota bacterium]